MAICPSNPRSRSPVTIRSCASDDVSAWPNEPGSLRIVLTLAVFLCFFGVPAMGDEPIGMALDLTSQVASAEKHLEAGKLREAAEQLRAADEQVKSDEIGEPSLDLTIPLARLAHACQADGNLEMAVEFYGRSVAASTIST